MKKAFLFMGLVLIAAGCVANQTQPVPSANDQNLQTYRNSSFNFEFKYPNDFSFVQPNYYNLTDPVVQLSISQDQYPKTNFGDAGFAVSYSAPKNQAACLDSSGLDSNEGFKDTTVINGLTFYKATGTGVGAGNIYDSRIYRVFRNNLCFEIQEVVHTGNIGNYPAGTVTAVDKTPIWARLDSVLESFKFTD